MGLDFSILHDPKTKRRALQQQASLSCFARRADKFMYVSKKLTSTEVGEFPETTETYPDMIPQIMVGRQLSEFRQ